MKKYVFIDCFNTIICRYNKPNQILQKWLKQVGQDMSIEPKFLYKWYKQIVLNTKINNKKNTGEFEYKMESVLDELSKKMKKYIKNVNTENLAKYMLNTYIKTELDNLYVNPNINIIIDNCIKHKIDMFVVSDFYCGKKVIQYWLEKLGIKNFFKDVFVSCDYNKSKRTGKLYKQILKELKINKKDVIMYGDNIQSDILSAKLRGIKSKKIKSTSLNNKHKKENHINLTKGGNFQELKQISNDYQDNLTLSNYAFSLYVFTKRLVDALIKDKVETIFFCSREGQFFKKLFDYYCNYHKIKIQSQYFLVSRNSVLTAGLKSIENEDFHCVLRETINMNIKRFLTTLSFTEDEINLLKNKTGLNFNKRFFRFGKSKYFKKLISTPEFLSIYDKKRLKQREAFSHYLDSFNYDYKTNGLYIVDIGWKGTIQDLLNHFFDSNVSLHGYYLGCKRPNTNSNIEKIGLLYNKDDKKRYGNKIFKTRMYDYEQICRANHNRVSGYEYINGKSIVNFANENNETAIFKKYVNPLQEQIFKKFKSICKYDYKYCSCIEEYALNCYIKLLGSYTKNDYAWIINVENNHYDNFARIGYNLKRYSAFLRLLYHKSTKPLIWIKNMLIYRKKINYK